MRAHYFAIGYLIFASALFCQPSTARTCPELLRNLSIPTKNHRWIRLPNDIRRFDVGKYEQARKKYVHSITKKNFQPQDHPKTFEEKLALLYDIKEQHQAPIPDFVNDQGGIDAYSAKTLAATLRKIDFEKGLTNNQIDELVTNLYLAQHLDPNTLRHLVKNGWTASLAELTRQDVDKQTAKTLLLQLAKKAGWLTEPKGLQKFAEWRRSHFYMLEGLFTAMGLTPILSGGLPLYLPSVNKGTPKFRLAWASLHRIYNWASFAFILASVWDDDKRRKVEAQTTSTQNLAEFEEKLNSLSPSGDEGSFEEELLSQWVEKYTKEHGHPPDPKGTEYIEAKRVFGVN